MAPSDEERRILRLATGHLFNAPSFTVFEDSVVLDQPSHSSKEGSDSFEPSKCSNKMVEWLYIDRLGRRRKPVAVA